MKLVYDIVWTHEVQGIPNCCWEQECNPQGREGSGEVSETLRVDVPSAAGQTAFGFES